MTGPAIHGPGDGRPPIKRGPSPEERRALADLVKHVRRLTVELTLEPEQSDGTWRERARRSA